MSDPAPETSSPAPEASGKRAKSSSWRALAAFVLWWASGMLPEIIADARESTLKHVIKEDGIHLVFILILIVYGLIQLWAAIRKRIWSDIIVFGVVPVALFVTGTIVLASDN